MDGRDRLARRPSRPVDAAPDAAAHRVVEYQYPGGAGDFGDEALGFGIAGAGIAVTTYYAAAVRAR